MKKTISIFLSILFLVPFVTSAHVKWFADDSYVNPIQNYQWSDGPVDIWITVVLSLIVFGVLFEYILPSPRKFSHPFFDYLDPIIISLFSIMTGIGFVVFSVSGYIFAPPLIPYSLFGYALILIQAIIGIGFVLGVFVQFLSLLLIAIYVMSAFYFGFQNALETLEILGISLMLFLSVKSRWILFSSVRLNEFAKQYRAYAIPFLRIFAGLNLIVLGFSEKILHPELGLSFLAKYHWNFMQILGFENFTDYWFVLSAGVVQVLFGLVFTLGIVTRINAFVVFCFYVPSLIILGPIEVFGHVLHFAMWIVLMVFGSGTKLKLPPLSSFFRGKQPIT